MLVLLIAAAGPARDAAAQPAAGTPYKAKDKDAIWAIAVGADGKTLATGHQNGLVKLWELPSLKEKAVLRQHKGPVYALALSKDGKRLVSGGGNYSRNAETPGEVVMWDLPAGRPTAELPGLAGPIYALAFSPDERTLAIGGVAKGRRRAAGEARLFDVARLQERFAISQANWDPVSALTFSPDGNTLVLGTGTPNGNDYRMWDPATGKELPRLWDGMQMRTLVGYMIPMVGQCSVAFSRDGKTAFTAGGKQTVHAWEMPSRAPLPTLDGHEKHVNALAVSPRGDLLATASRDHTVRLWDILSRTERIRLRGHANSVNAVAFTRDGKTLVTADADGIIQLWWIDELFKGDMDE
jgi:WD40 repeat protein